MPYGLRSGRSFGQLSDPRRLLRPVVEIQPPGHGLHPIAGLVRGAGVVAIRIRTVDGVRVALCAVESDEKAGDLYLDDADHYALAAKFSQDWAGEEAGWPYPREWQIMATQKLRDARAEHDRWMAEQEA